MIELKIQHKHNKKVLEKQPVQDSNKIQVKQQRKDQSLSDLTSQSQDEIQKTYSVSIEAKKGMTKANDKTISKKKQERSSLENYYERINISQLLFQQIMQSQGLLNLQQNSVIQAISNSMRFVQDRHYLSQVSNNITYLQRHKQEIKNIDRKNALEQLFADMHADIISDIWNDQYTIDKKSLKEKQKRQKIQQMRYNIESKLSNMKNSLNLSQLTDFQSSNTGNLIVTAPELQKNQKVRKNKASVFIKKIVEQKKQLQRKKLQREISQQKKRQDQQKLKHQMQQAARKQRHEKIRDRHQQARNSKQMELKQAQQRKKQFDSFLSEYKHRVPLYRQIQKKYQNQIVQKENSRVERVLKKIKEERKPLSIDDLIQHQNWYRKMKSQNQQRRSLDMKEEMERRKVQNINYYKGHAHTIVQEQIQKARDGSFIEYEKKMQIKRKQQSYVNKILINFKPKPSSAKKRQLQDLQQRRKWSQRLRQQALMKQKNRYQQGNKNFDSLKQYNKRLRQQGKVVSSQRTTQTSRTLQPRPNYRNYLQEIRQQKVFRSGKERQSINYSAMLQRDPSSFAVRLSKLQEKGKRKEQYIRQISHLPIQTYLYQRTSLNENYLETARAKLALLNQLK